MPSPLTIAFRQQFPEGSILSEVLTIYDGLFVVRVSVQVGGVVLSQALGGNNSLELAEDIAYNRAIERLGLDLTPTDSPSSVPRTEESQPAQTVTHAAANVGANFSNSVRDHQPGSASATEPEVQATNFQAPRETSSTDRSLPSTDAPAPLTVAKADQHDGHTTSETIALPTTESKPALSHLTAPPRLSLATPPAPKTAPAEKPPAQEEEPETRQTENHEAWGHMASEPIDLSDIIAQTDVELQRLGWDVHQGREFLEKTYGKRSRHDLTDEELLEFLLHLESQPPPAVT